MVDRVVADIDEIVRIVRFDAWPALPAAVRHGLLTIINAVSGDRDEAPR